MSGLRTCPAPSARAQQLREAMLAAEAREDAAAEACERTRVEFREAREAWRNARKAYTQALEAERFGRANPSLFDATEEDK
jgi:hypothetical protein